MDQRSQLSLGNITRTTFSKIAALELQYRRQKPENTLQVLDDIYQTALCICMRGLQDPDEYRLLQDGIRRIGNFLIGDKYTLDSAIVDASKVAYLCKLIEKGIDKIRHYSPEMLGDLTGQVLQQPMPTKLNKLKKTHPEAFFYFNEIQLMQ